MAKTIIFNQISSYFNEKNLVIWQRFFFSFERKNIEQGCQNCILSVQRKPVEEKTSFKLFCPFERKHLASLNENGEFEPNFPGRV